ncbi:hypothetical protein SAMN05443144_10579 [Fodinibius roseus]|uniref:Uncharacterized protein n=1 Tax=Fodinibius roseus TaxID=1194090 RepID=A0A1M4YJH0_9BACT|nr:hypothetical protein SAMN05443144_10579 [Fodinibius roseus]
MDLYNPALCDICSRMFTVQVFYYQLQANDLSFYRNATIPSLQLEEYRCFSTDDL